MEAQKGFKYSKCMNQEGMVAMVAVRGETMCVSKIELLLLSIFGDQLKYYSLKSKQHKVIAREMKRTRLT